MIISADQTGINDITEAYIHRLAGYLKKVHDADPEIAADCSHQAFTKVFEKIRNRELSDVENIYSYLIRSAKNEYLMVLRRKKNEIRSEPDSMDRMEGDTASDVAGGLDSEDKENALKACVEMLRESGRNFYLDVLKHINETDAAAAKKLGMSHAGFRTRKFRLVQTLRDCVKRKGY